MSMKNVFVYQAQKRYVLLYFVPTVNLLFVSFKFAFTDVSMANTIIMFLLTLLSFLPLYFPINYLLKPTVSIFEDEVEIKKLWGGKISFNRQNSDVVIRNHGIKFESKGKKYILRKLFSDSDWNDLCQDLTTWSKQ